MDWVTEAIKLKNSFKWEELPDKLYEITGEMYAPEKIRAACRRRLAKLDDVGSSSKEGSDEVVPNVYEENGIYTITARSARRDPVYLSKNILRELKRMYCTRPYPTMNECSRKLNIPRDDLYLILKAFKITHTDIPYIDEDLVEREIEDLAFESIEYQKQRYIETLSKVETDKLREEVLKYRKKEYFYNMLHNLVVRDLPTIKPYSNDLPRSKEVAELMLEIPIVDLHLGKLAWKPETGDNYDYKIAVERFDTITEDIIARVAGKKFERILYPIGQDFFHFDTLSTTTSAGTPQDSDLRWQKLFLKGIEMLIRQLTRFAEIAPIDALVIPGNHDKMTAFYAMIVLEAWFKDTDRVTVNTDPKTRKYFEFGKCLIGYTHGDKERNRIWGNMQVEAPVAWGRTKYREWHTGHLHSEQVKEEHGVVIRRLPSVTGTDAWHFESGYVGAVTRHQSFIWNKHKGLSDILVTTIE